MIAEKYKNKIGFIPGFLPLEVFWAHPTGWRLRTCWRDYMSHLVWECQWPVYANLLKIKFTFTFNAV